MRQSNPNATVRALQTDVFHPDAQHALKACDLLIVATDNHASRMAANRLAVQYLIPLLHAGFNITVDNSQSTNPQSTGSLITDVSGEFALPDLGRWCLQCAGIVDPQLAGWELAPAAQREVLRQRGYVDGTPAPAVGHLDGVVAALAATEIHNLVHPFRPAGDGRTHRYLVYDALRASLTPLQVTPSETCPVCSADEGVLGLGDLEPLPDYRRQPSLPPVLRPSPAAPLPAPRPIAIPAPEAAVASQAGTPGVPALRVAAPQLVAPSPRPDRQPAQVPLPDGRARARRLQAALDTALDPAFDPGPDPDWP